MARIALIDPSGRSTTTVQAVLGRVHDLIVRSRVHAPGDCDLVIADLRHDDLADSSTVRGLRSFGPVLLLVERLQPIPLSVEENSDLVRAAQALRCLRAQDRRRASAARRSAIPRRAPSSPAPRTTTRSGSSSPSCPRRPGPCSAAPRAWRRRCGFSVSPEREGVASPWPSAEARSRRCAWSRSSPTSSWPPWSSASGRTSPTLCSFPRSTRALFSNRSGSRCCSAEGSASGSSRRRSTIRQSGCCRGISREISTNT